MPDELSMHAFNSLLPRVGYYPSDDILRSNGPADPRVVETTSVIMIPVGRAERRKEVGGGDLT